MPSISKTILIITAWLFSTGLLIYRDVLPNYLVGEPPDWKKIVSNPESTPVSWLIGVENKDDQLSYIGEATTQKIRQGDGSTLISSNVKLDARGLFSGTPLAITEATVFQFQNSTRISKQGLLDQLSAEVRVKELGEKPVLMISALPKTGGKLELKFKSHISPLLNFSQVIPFNPQQMVQSGMEPMEYLPGLRIGQRWTTELLQPTTGRPDTLRSEVTELGRIFWNGNPTEVFIVNHKASTFSAKSWVRRDGLVLRQQLPTPFVKIMIERQPGGSAP